MATSDEAAFLDDIARMLEASELAVGVAPASPDDAPLTDDLRLALISDDDDDVGIDATMVSPREPLDDARERRTPTRPLSRSTACRIRQRQELEYMRNQVRDLEDRLDELQRAKRSSSPATSASSDEDTTKSDSTKTSAMWERIAKRQMSAKQRAEVENAKLRGLLEDHVKIARGLERVLRKRSTLEEVLVSSETKRRKRVDSTDEATYQQLLDGLDERYHGLSTAFEENGLANNHSDLEDVRVLSTGDTSQLSVEILYAKALPFDFATTSGALWECTSSSYIQLTQGFYVSKLAEKDLLKSKFEIPLTVRRHSVTMHMFVAIRRYPESDTREAYTWESSSILSSAHKTYDGIRFTDYGWTVVESLGSGDAATTIIQSCLRIIPDESTLPRQSPVGVLHDVLIASYKCNFATLNEIIESTLLRTTRTGGTATHPDTRHT